MNFLKQFQKLRHPLFLVPILFLLVVAPAVAQEASNPEPDRLADIDSRLNAVADASFTERMISGWSLAVGGPLAAGTCVILIETSNLAPEDKLLPDLLYAGLGLSAAGMGIYRLLAPAEGETAYLDFSALAETTDAERALKIEKGEAFLASLAGNAFSSRMIGGTVLSSLAVIDLVIYALYFSSLAPGPITDMLNVSLGYPMLAIGISSGIAGILCFLLPTRAEIENDAYVSAKKSAAGPDEAALPIVLESVRITPGGFSVLFSM